jgi:NitT/TauT family transport system permease protein
MTIGGAVHSPPPHPIDGSPMDTQTPVRPFAVPPASRARVTRLGAARWRALGSMVGLPVLGFAAVLGAWWLATTLYDIRPLFLPPPGTVFSFVVENPVYFAEHAWTTLYQTVAGFGIATVAGLVTAVLLASSRILERATMPLVVSLNAIPKVALAPLLIIWLGFEDAPKIALAALICFFPIVVATMAGLNATPAELGELARSLSAPRWQTFFKIRAPWALPQVFVGLKVGITLALIGTIVAQIQNPAGLGGVIQSSSTTANTSITFAAILVLLVISLVLFYAVVLLEYLLLPWARETTAGRR